MSLCFPQSFIYLFLSSLVGYSVLLTISACLDSVILGNSSIFSQVACVMPPAICWRLPLIAFLSFSPLCVFFPSLSLSVSYRIFFQLVVSCKSQLAVVKETKVFSGIAYLCLDFQQWPMPNMSCIYRGYLFLQQQVSSCRKKKELSKMQVIFLTSSGCLLHANMLCLYALFLYKKLYSKGRGEGRNVKLVGMFLDGKLSSSFIFP